MKSNVRLNCLVYAALSLVVALSGSPTGSAQAIDPGTAFGSYEEPPVLRAADRLPAALLAGPHHSVEPEAQTDGFMSYYTIQSEYGVYKAASLEEAERRISEIYAIAALEEMGRAEIAGKGFAEGVRQPFLAVKSVVTRPAETAGRVGESLGRWVGRTKLDLRKLGRQTKEAAKEAKDTYEERREQRRTRELAEQEVRDRAAAEGRDPDEAVAEHRRHQEVEGQSPLAAESDAQRKVDRIQRTRAVLKKAVYDHVGYEKARRMLAQELGVDPYSTNLELQERLDAMAWAYWSGRFATGYALPSNKLTGYATDVDSLVWKSHPKDLEVRSRKELKAMGLVGGVVDAFFDHPYYSISDRTRIVADLVALEGVSHRGEFLDLAVAADSPLAAEYYRRSAEMIAISHARSPLERIVAQTDRLLFALRRSGELLLFLAVDHAAWTETLDLLVGGVEREARNRGFEGAIALVLAGDLTERARREIEDVGWVVETWTLHHLADSRSEKVSAAPQESSGTSTARPELRLAPRVAP